MGLIRHAQLEEVVRDAIVLDLADINTQADHVRAAAAAEANRLVVEATQQATQVRHRAHAQGVNTGRTEGYGVGYAEGQKEGHDEAFKEHAAHLETLISQWQTALDDFNTKRDNMLLTARTDVIKLAVLIAERVTRRTIAHDPSVVTAQLAGVLDMLTTPSRLTLGVHPDDAPLVQEALPALVRTFDDAAHTEVVADAAIERGSVIAHTGTGGVIDASISTQLDRIIADLLPSPGAPA